MTGRVRWVGLVGLPLACAPPPPSAPTPELPPAPTVAVPSRIVAPNESGTAEELLALARLDHDNARCEAALRRVERVQVADAGGPHAAEAYYLEGLCQEQLGRHEASARAFTAAYSGAPSSPFALGAAIRASRLWIFLERAEAAEDAARFAIERFDAELAARDRVAVYGARALGALRRNEVKEAEYWTGKARIAVSEGGLDSGGLIPRDLAQMYFALGEIRKIRSEAIPFDPMPADFPRAFETRAQLLLDAQGAYADVMRAEDAFWSARAGTRIGELYANLHRAVVTMPTPSGAEARRLGPLFEGAMRLRYLVLLEKGLAMVEHTVAMAQRTDPHAAWAQRAASTRDRMSALLAAENRAIDALPHSRESLRQVLTELQRRKADPPPPTSP